MNTVQNWYDRYAVMAAMIVRAHDLLGAKTSIIRRDQISAVLPEPADEARFISEMKLGDKMGKHGFWTECVYIPEPGRSGEDKFYFTSNDRGVGKLELRLTDEDHEAALRENADALGLTRYMLYWRGGSSEIVAGTSIEDAFSKAGYGGGAVGALDFYMPHYHRLPSYEWNKGTREWDKIEGRQGA